LVFEVTASAVGLLQEVHILHHVAVDPGAIFVATA